MGIFDRRRETHIRSGTSDGKQVAKIGPKKGWQCPVSLYLLGLICNTLGGAVREAGSFRPEHRLGPTRIYQPKAFQLRWLDVRLPMNCKRKCRVDAFLTVIKA